MPGLPRSLRAEALERIVTLATSPSAQPSSVNADLRRLLGALPSPRASCKGSAQVNGTGSSSTSLASAPMTIGELDILLALCKAAPRIADPSAAAALLERLRPYLCEAHEQAFAPSPFLARVDPSPWETLSYHLVTALLALAKRHGALRKAAGDALFEYLRNCLATAARAGGEDYKVNGASGRASRADNPFETVVLAISLVGFMDATSAQLDALHVEERLHVIQGLRTLLSDDFMVAFEGSLSSIRNSEMVFRSSKELRQYSHRYTTLGRPLGAMLLQQGFLSLLVSSSSLQVTYPSALRENSILDHLIAQKQLPLTARHEYGYSLNNLSVEIAEEILRILEDGADYLELASTWQQHLALQVRGQALTVLLNCLIVDEDADSEGILTLLEASLADPVQMANEELACIVLKSLVVVAKTSPVIATSLGRSMPRFIVQGGLQGPAVLVAAQCLAAILQQISPDAVITGLYSLGNVLSAPSNDKGIVGARPSAPAPTIKGSTRYTQHSTGSAISLGVSGDEETFAAYSNVVRAIVGVAVSCDDEHTTSLAQSMLLQKLGRIDLVVDLQIIVETADLGAIANESDLKSLLKLYDRLNHDAVVKGNDSLSEAVSKARLRLAKLVKIDSDAFQTYVLHLLETIVSKGDIHEREMSTPKQDFELAALEVCQLLAPLAHLAPNFPANSSLQESEDFVRLQREVWFNIAVHGIAVGSDLWNGHELDLLQIARFSEPLISSDHADGLEGDIELDTVLRRGMTAPRTATLKKSLIDLLPSQEASIRSLEYPKVVFLHAAYALEVLRAETGGCTDVLSYFVDASVHHKDTWNCMIAIANAALSTFLKATLGRVNTTSAAPRVARELATAFTFCCHRIEQCRHVATSFADRLVAQLPAALCQKESLFALLELLSLMWASNLDGDLDEYEWKAHYCSTLVPVAIELSDDFADRKRTLDQLFKNARGWVLRILNIAPWDVKGLFQSYLAESNDSSALGQIALGRSFALEMGLTISPSDQRLATIKRQHDGYVNSGSDFIYQYTTRQEYKYAEALPGADQEWKDLLRNAHRAVPSSSRGPLDVSESQRALESLYRRALEGRYIAVSELRDALQRAAAILCRSPHDQCAVVQYLVAIPFAVLTEQSIKLGIAIWLGVINENPRMEPRFLTQIAMEWEASARRGAGAFSTHLRNEDPFFLKEEFAPSDRDALFRRRQAINSLITPHLRVLQFLSSHFNAYRLSSPSLRRCFQRLAAITLTGLRRSACHPLAREFHFHAILFATAVLRYSDDLGRPAQWRLKDRLLGAGLAWFARPPAWSYGGNRIQIQAECQILTDVERGLSLVAAIGAEASSTLGSLAVKQDLLVRFLQHEVSRLQVWLYPLNVDPDQPRASSVPDRAPLLAMTSQHVQVAWAEDPKLAFQVAVRAPSPQLTSQARWYLLNRTDQCIDDAESLQILFDNQLPNDVSASQLKYLLYWNPINPITAATLFMPAFKNDPFIIQYAMRSLESHSVDITFFYVPQLVQTLRYDALGYVERYIVETGRFSQLFAHQIIWNIRANAYKDEDATIEDPLKPALDRVVDKMVSSFSGTDKAFYEKEFAFFNEITDISGKLRPYIKKEKSEKKQKIEEELRKINVEVGVYLPSNPDGEVVGIDRKSGKPLQSHAKAPYMATFRIKRNKSGMEGTENLLTTSNATGNAPNAGTAAGEHTYEVWQSAIFKVGDDCRQDVLALQMIAAFRGIFNHVGLDVFVYPYRVTATAPGCGVIDVLPNSISRDMLGREAVNGLHDYFLSRFGGAASPRFQAARGNFVKSMAAYSVLSYLLQFKDRHNGNIMVDDQGHVLHIDFGFCFDIAPGGVRFERAPFKLTAEMVAVLGSGPGAQSYRWFEELCVKAFLAARPFAEKLCHMVVLMLDSGLPCFKPVTVAHFRQRFVLEKNEREAAEFMRDLVAKSYKSFSTKGYDMFQLATNGIPY